MYYQKFYPTFETLFIKVILFQKILFLRSNSIIIKQFIHTRRMGNNCHCVHRQNAPEIEGIPQTLQSAPRKNPFGTKYSEIIRVIQQSSDPEEKMRDIIQMVGQDTIINQIQSLLSSDVSNTRNQKQPNILQSRPITCRPSHIQNKKSKQEIINQLMQSIASQKNPPIQMRTILFNRKLLLPDSKVFTQTTDSQKIGKLSTIQSMNQKSPINSINSKISKTTTQPKSQWKKKRRFNYFDPDYQDMNREGIFLMQAPQNTSRVRS